MGLLDFFKRNKKSKADIVKTVEPSPEQTLFAETVADVFTPVVERFGFVRTNYEVEAYFTTVIFRKGKQYIKISGSTYPTDYPYSYNVMLGEGDSEDFIEWDWNSIPLWRLKVKVDLTAEAREYQFPYAEQVKFSVLNAGKELLQYADSYLHGDLTLFYETRSEQNKNREPYKISTRDDNGNCKTTYEPKSVAQKKKYS